MAHFHPLNIPPPGVNRDPLPPKSKLPIALRDQLYETFLAELRQPKSPFGMLMMTLPSFEPFVMRLERVGSTALTVRRLSGMETKAITLALSGGEDDEQALAFLETELVGNQDAPRSGIQPLIAMIRNEPRPVSATVHCDEASYDDQATRICAFAACGAFFDLVAESR